jgi:hypothetical protein
MAGDFLWSAVIFFILQFQYKVVYLQPLFGESRKGG